VERASETEHPYSRVRDLWTGFESALPAAAGGAMARVDTWVAGAARNRHVNVARIIAESDGAVTLLLRNRQRLARLPGTGQNLRSRLDAAVSTNSSRLATALAVSYAVRSQLQHGRWSHLVDSELPVARAASRLLWRTVTWQVQEALLGAPQPRGAVTKVFSINR
jgi:hypothetical protein